MESRWFAEEDGRKHQNETLFSFKLEDAKVEPEVTKKVRLNRERAISIGKQFLMKLMSQLTVQKHIII